ncbi:hypothetical protein M3610_26820 [Neobacillus sp. MER 74]|uniref:hypothetical protein n=1 Tax=Neobacillus sp. MER 74 TaxID=2939566 RepID=UPI00203DCA65|nr:hypothetical protein [Neobacillus sp. MER 74]MCM3118796.1 hypothetical protein [Neobacillus sp. MER 74]HWL23554.1 hypothetical protein [Ureibacillus sp.]
MKYEYQPTMLNTWVRDNRGIKISTSIENMNTKYKGELELLKENFKVVKHFPIDSFSNWANGLSRRQKLLLPNLYDQNLKPEIKDNLLQVIQTNAKSEKRLFRVLVDSLYQSCDMDELWKLVKFSYEMHEEKLQNRLREEEASKWKSFLNSKEPVHHLAVRAYESKNDFLQELESFYLTDNFPLYRLVLMEVFSFADESFFAEEKSLYKKYFKLATNEEQQKMAEGLIKNCKLNNVRDLGKFIYERLKTYRRKPMLWNKVGEEERKRFANWILKMEIKDFFGNVNTNHERYKYWKKFIVNLEDVVVTDNRTTMIMYFPDVVVMEVLGTGAVYVYKASDFHRYFQKKIDTMLAEKEKYQNSYYVPREVKRSELMDKYRTIKGGWLTHTGDWQFKFDHWLRSYLGWEVDEHALLQKEAERDEGFIDS